MTAATTQTGLTVRTFLLGSETEDDCAVLRHALSEHDILSQCGGELAGLVPKARQAADDTLASVTAGLLDIDLGDVLIYGWRTHDRLVKAARQTMRVPGRQEVVQLGSHQFTWTKKSDDRPTGRWRPGAYFPFPADDSLRGRRRRRDRPRRQIGCAQGWRWLSYRCADTGNASRRRPAP